jgi:hypothetical protein
MCRLMDWQMFTDVSQELTLYIYKVKEQSIMKMYAVRFSETGCHNPGDRVLDSRLRENQKFQILILS